MWLVFSRYGVAHVAVMVPFRNPGLVKIVVARRSSQSIVDLLSIAGLELLRTAAGVRAECIIVQRPHSAKRLLRPGSVLI